MSASATVLEDNSTLSRIDQVYFRLETILTLLGGVVILLLVFLASTNVLGISESARVETFECGIVPAIFMATIKPFSKPNLAEKIHNKPTKPAIAAAKATRTPMTTRSNIHPVTHGIIVVVIHIISHGFINRSQ